MWTGLGVGLGEVHSELPDKDILDKAARMQVTGMSSQLSKSQEGHHSGLSPHTAACGTHLRLPWRRLTSSPSKRVLWIPSCPLSLATPQRMHFPGFSLG